MAAVSSTARPAYVWDAESNAWIPLGVLTHTHAESDVTSLTADLALKAPLASPTFTGTVTLPTGTVTSAMILDGTIVDADINASAAIAQSKISGLTTALAAKTANINTYITDSTTARTVTGSTDIYGLITMTSASAIQITAPSDTADTNWPVGSWVSIRQMGAGQITVVAGSGATVVATDSQVKTRVQYSEISLEKVSANTWLVQGDTTA